MIDNSICLNLSILSIKKENFYHEKTTHTNGISLCFICLFNNQYC